MTKLFFVNLPHTETNDKYVACAYTQKLVKLAPKMMDRGYEVHIIGGENNATPCDAYHVAVSEEDRRRWFGDQDFHSEFFNITWGGNEPHWIEMNKSAIEYIKENIGERDIICLIAGHCQKMIADAFPGALSVEYGIGYSGIFANYKVFESYSHMHKIYGEKGIEDGQFYDAVIHNYFDPEDFDLGEGNGDYLFWMGRYIERKGPEIAVEVANRLGMKLIMAGQGAVDHGDGTITALDGSFPLKGDLVHVGHIDAAERNALMGRAKAFIMPTVYIEPFGGVAVEAMMAGTPVVATDFGAFTETVTPTVGQRFRTIGEAVHATEQVFNLPRVDIRRHAIENYSSREASFKYDMYFQQLQTLFEDGFYSDWYPTRNRMENA